MINRYESQLLAKERSNRLARTGAAPNLLQQPAVGLPRQSANDPLPAPAKERRR